MQVECPSGFLKWLLNVGYTLCLEMSFLQLPILMELEMLHFSKKTINEHSFSVLEKVTLVTYVSFENVGIPEGLGL